MGGLVSRAYVQGFAKNLYGQNEDFDYVNAPVHSLFMIATPNNGSSWSYPADWISEAGEDMKPNSLFLNELNSNAPPAFITRYTNVLGLGTDIRTDLFKPFVDYFPEPVCNYQNLNKCGSFNANNMTLNGWLNHEDCSPICNNDLIQFIINPLSYFTKKNPPGCSLSDIGIGYLNHDGVVTTCGNYWKYAHSLFLFEYHNNKKYKRSHLNICKNDKTDPLFEHLKDFLYRPDYFDNKYKSNTFSFSELPEIDDVRNHV